MVDELNAKYNHRRKVEKCRRKMKYLVDKYMERKDWNPKQSGGSIWNSPHYVEIQSASGYGPPSADSDPPTKLSF